LIRLSEHFCDNWLERVGNWPNRRLIKRILKESVPIHPCRNLYDENGNPYRIFAIYWHPDMDVVIKVDEFENRAVTVLSRENYEQRNGFPGEGKINEPKKRKPDKKRRKTLLYRRAKERAMSM